MLGAADAFAPPNIFSLCIETVTTASEMEVMSHSEALSRLTVGDRRERHDEMDTEEGD